jgi:hypothetical protein
MPYAYSPGAIGGLDDFTGIAAGTALNGRTAPSGGAWATSGVAGDFLATDGPGANDETMSRATTGDLAPGRVALLGSTSYTASEVAVSVQWTTIGTAPSVSAAAVTRYVDASNECGARLSHFNGGELALYVREAGSQRILAAAPVRLVAAQRYLLRAITYATGTAFAELRDASSGALIAHIAGRDAGLATGGAVASGLPGFVDSSASATANTRYYDNFYVATPAPEPIVIHAGRSIQFRHDGVLRQDSTGTYAGPPPEYVGGRFFVPPAGSAGRKARVAVIARRNDVTTMADDHIADSTIVQVFVTPRYLVVPRA